MLSQYFEINLYVHITLPWANQNLTFGRLNVVLWNILIYFTPRRNVIFKTISKYWSWPQAKVCLSLIQNAPQRCIHIQIYSFKNVKILLHKNVTNIKFTNIKVNRNITFKFLVSVQKKLFWKIKSIMSNLIGHNRGKRILPRLCKSFF